jgi:predicted Fe-Mo cluster-binding NifX family protein
MKIVFVTDDHQTISAHFGRAQYYEIFTISAGQVTARETLARSFPQLVPVAGDHTADGAHQHQHDHSAMLTPIADCQVLITRGMGNGAHLSLKAHGIQPIITDISEIQVALDAYLAGTLVDHPEKLH